MILPIISVNLLDKTVRSYLLQYLVMLHDRGEGRVYALTAGRFGEEKTYYNKICDWNFDLYNEGCTRIKEQKGSCLGCPKIDECPVWCAQYERKKAKVQEYRYTEVLREAITAENIQKKKALTTEDIMQTLIENIGELSLTQKGFIDRVSVKILLEKHLDITASDRSIKEYTKRLMLQISDYAEKTS